MMVYSNIRQPKLSDVIEQRLESLISEGILRPGEKLLPERELAKKFAVSRPSLREAILRLESKGLLVRRHGGGTYVQTQLWPDVSHPLVNLLTQHQETQFDLLETRHAFEGISAWYAALRGTDEDFLRIKERYQAILSAQQQGDVEAETQTVMRYQITVAEATHNIVLLHLLHGLQPILTPSVRDILQMIYTRADGQQQINVLRAAVFEAIMAREPEKARDASHRHLAFIEDILLVKGREQTRRERSLRRLQQRQG